MAGRSPRELLDAAQSRVGRGRALLRQAGTADADHCETLLREACEELAKVVETLRGGVAGDSGLRDHAVALQREIQQVEALLDQGARFARQWLERLGAANAGYTPRGAMAPILRCGRISMAG